MSRIFLVLARRVSPVLLLVLFASTQLFSQTQSLGDVAREQKEIQKQHENNGKQAKILTNDDLASGSTAAASGTTGSPAASMEDQSPQPKETKSTASEHEPVETTNIEGRHKGNFGVSSPIGSVLDRRKDSTPDFIVVPAGTELKVDLGQHKTIVPVRVGFATPIPALSQVGVEVTRSLVDIPYSYAGTPNTVAPYIDYVEYATVTAVTVAGRTYPVKTDSLPLQKGGTNSEVTFILGGPLNILR